MSDDAVKQRLTELHNLHQVRVGQADDRAKQSRPDLRALMAKASDTPGDETNRLPGKLGILAQLARNPEIRHALLQWLQQQDDSQRPLPAGGAGAENAWGLDFGVDAVARSEELTTSSTLEEITRYYQQLENRADWLESALQETLLEMQRVSRFKLAASEVTAPEQPLAPPVDPSI
ncbi:MAG: hypothetical protein ABTR07_00245 [Candidatus Competibacter denitrificans]